MTTRPTFISRNLPDGSTAFRCRETGTRYIVAPTFHGNTVLYREGELIASGDRATCVNRIETVERFNLLG